jgi:hypothetical protein
MSETNPAPSAPDPEPAKTKRVSGEIAKRHLDDIQLAHDVFNAASDPVHAPVLASEALDAPAVAVVATLTADARDLCGKVALAKKARLAATRGEDAASKALIAALRDVQKRAKRKFPKDKTRLATYAIGKNHLGSNRTGLEQDAENILKLAAEDALPGLTPAKLTAANAALAAWNLAHAKQAKATEDQGQFLADLATTMTTLNEARRNIQRAADTAWPHTTKAHASIRRSFKLPATKPWIQ